MELFFILCLEVVYTSQFIKLYWRNAVWNTTYRQSQKRRTSLSYAFRDTKLLLIRSLRNTSIETCVKKKKKHFEIPIHSGILLVVFALYFLNVYLTLFVFYHFYCLVLDFSWNVESLSVWCHGWSTTPQVRYGIM